MSNLIVSAPMQWAAVPDLGDVDAVNGEDRICLIEIAEVLSRHGKSERFAVHLVHKHFEVAPDEVMCEFTDVMNRVLTTRPVKRDAGGGIVETTWMLRVEGGEVMQTCHYSCYPVTGSSHQYRHNGQSSPG